MLKGTKVFVRCYSGVFYGKVTDEKDLVTGMLTLSDVRHVYRWKSDGLPRKALNVADLAILGCGTGTQISGTAPEITLLDCKEIVKCTKEACERMESLPCLA